MSFSKLGLSPSLCLPLARLGYEQPTPVQADVHSLRPDGRDLLARAQTGTGKTAAFGLPMIERLLVRGGVPPARASRAASCSCRRASWRSRSTSRSPPTARRRICASPPSSAASRSCRRSRRCAGHRHHRRHARPPARPHGAAHGRSVGVRDPHARRSRSDARHGLPAAAARGSPALPRERQTLLFSATMSQDVVAPRPPTSRAIRCASTCRRGRSWRRP